MKRYMKQIMVLCLAISVVCMLSSCDANIGQTTSNTSSTAKSSEAGGNEITESASAILLNNNDFTEVTDLLQSLVGDEDIFPNFYCGYREEDQTYLITWSLAPVWESSLTNDDMPEIIQELMEALGEQTSDYILQAYPQHDILVEVIVTNSSGSKNMSYWNCKEGFNNEAKPVFELPEIPKLELTTAEKVAIDAAQIIKDSLNAPNSIQIYSIEVCTKASEYLIRLDYSGQNQLGGTVRKTQYLDADLQGTVSTYALMYEQYALSLVLVWDNDKSTSIDVGLVMDNLK